MQTHTEQVQFQLAAMHILMHPQQRLEGLLCFVVFILVVIMSHDINMPTAICFYFSFLFTISVVLIQNPLVGSLLFLKINTRTRFFYQNDLKFEVKILFNKDKN